MGEVDNDINRFGVHHGAVVATCVEDGGADVNREGYGWEGSGSGGWSWVGTG